MRPAGLNSFSIGPPNPRQKIEGILRVIWPMNNNVLLRNCPLNLDIRNVELDLW